MKIRISIFFIAVFHTVVVNAQSGQLKGGINFANVSVTDNGRVDEANMLTSFQLGLLGDLRLGGPVYFQPGVLFSGKGSKVQRGNAGSDGYFKQTFNPYYIEIPATVVFKLPIGGGGKFFAGAGPYMGIGVGGKVKTDGQTSIGGLRSSYSSERNITFSDDDPTTLSDDEGAGFGIVKRFDYGLNGTAGIEGKSIVLSANYGLGLAKLQSGSNNSVDHNNKHRVLSFTLGFKM